MSRADGAVMVAMLASFITGRTGGSFWEQVVAGVVLGLAFFVIRSVAARAGSSRRTE